MKILSLGWGVQSFTLAAMVALGELEPVDYAVHADTTHERSDTYAFAERWTPWLEERGVKVVTVKQTNENKIALVDKWVGIKLPAFTINGEKIGRINRQCTFAWKIHPLRKWTQENRNKKPVEMWIGISLDEFQRMRQSDVKYITNVYPLVDRRMTRWACVQWLQSNGLELPPKSACVFCPYHDTASWRELKESGNGDWHKAVEVDNLIRGVRPPYDLFLHRSCKPLEEVDLSTPEDHGQLRLWDEECSGICGV
jgi:hypothetical protein